MILIHVDNIESVGYISIRKLTSPREEMKWTEFHASEKGSYPLLPFTMVSLHVVVGSKVDIKTWPESPKSLNLW